MECLICYRVEVNFEAEKYKKSATIFCQVFGIPATSEEPFYSSTVCDLCLQRLADLEVMLREIQRIQENVNKVKGEMEKDLLNSQRLSEEESKISQPRVKIINDITSRRSIEDHDAISTNSLQPTLQFKLEEGESQPLQIEDFDHFQLDFSPAPVSSPANESSVPLTEFPNAEKPIKNALILLEKLPVLVGGSSINVNQEPIKSYTLRNPPLRSSASNSQIGQNIQEKGARGRPKRRRKKALFKGNKPKPKARRMTKDEYEDYKAAKRLSRTCTICDKAFDQKFAFLNHMNRYHYEGAEPSFKCQECGKGFFTNPLLKSHLISHGIVNNIVNCPLCEKPFENQTKCDLHVSVVHRKEKPHICEFCGLSFAYPAVLKTHCRVVHHGEKIICNEPGCGKEFSVKYNLEMHIRRFHQQDFKFSCSECDKKYAVKAQLNVHIRKVHRKERNCLCQHCPARFFNENILKSHMMAVHLKERPFKCTICSKGFPYKQSLNNHLILHSEDRPFVCQYCGEAYHVGPSLKIHIKRKHSEDSGMHLVADPNKRRKVGRRSHVKVVPGTSLIPN